MSGTIALCSCGTYHPAGFVCERAKPVLSATDKKEACGCCAPTESTPGGDQPKPESAYPQRDVFRIPDMDCAAEEALIRGKLQNLPGVGRLEFNLMQRTLTVHHTCPAPGSIIAALQAIGMTPEAVAPALETVTVFAVRDMDCPVEENLIRAKLSGLAGVLEMEFNLMQRTLKVRHEASALSAVASALRSLNLGAEPMEKVSGKSVVPPAAKIPWRRLAFAGVLAAAAELFDLWREWQSELPGVDPNAWTINGAPVLDWLPMVLAVAAILAAGLGTYRKGWIAIRNLNLNINALMSVAVTGAFIIGQFPEAAMVMVLFNLAEAIEAGSLEKARNAIRTLLDLTPAKATVQRADGTWEEIDVHYIAVESRVRVRPGERVALDGVIEQGRSSVNQAPITGESLPIEKNPGDAVYAGTINESGSFEFRVTAIAADSTLARIIHAVEQAQGSRAPTQRFVDRFARYYTPAVFLAALLTAIGAPLLMGGAWTQWIYTALVILVIGCPCALVISTPVSIVSGMAAATRHGILVKGGLFLELGRRLRWLALDKTGTLTHGRPKQTDFVALDSSDEAAVVRLASSLAARSDHPVSKAIAEAAAEKGIALLDVTDFAAMPGQGVSGVIEGERWHLGNHRMVEALGKCRQALEAHMTALEKQGKSVVALIGEKGVRGLFAVADTLKESSIEAVRELKALGIQTMMLTGDNEHTARAIAEQAGVDGFKGNLLPEDKLAAIEQLARQGTVGMVGDGINDTPALARADIGFAMAAAGADTAIETADVALMDDDLRKIARFVRLSKSTHAILVQNIALALGVKALFFALTFAGLTTMWMAVFADVGTSLLVVANGLRAMRK